SVQLYNNIREYAAAGYSKREIAKILHCGRNTVTKYLNGDCKSLCKYSVDRLEAACRKALSFTAAPSYKSIKNILDTGNDQTEMPDKGKATDSHHATDGSHFSVKTTLIKGFAKTHNPVISG